MSEGLKECPNCGSHKVTCEYGWNMGTPHPDGRFVMCEDCGLSGVFDLNEGYVIASWNSLPRKLKWTKNKPTVSGWYWWRFEENIVPHMVYVVLESVLRPVEKDRWLILYPNSTEEFEVETRGGEWSGPIPEPEDA